MGLLREPLQPQGASGHRSVHAQSILAKAWKDTQECLGVKVGRPPPSNPDPNGDWQLRSNRILPTAAATIL